MMRFASLIFTSLFIIGCNKFDPKKISAQSPKKVECFDEKGSLIFSGTAQKAAEMVSRKGFLLTDLSGKEFEIAGECKLAE